MTPSSDYSHGVPTVIEGVGGRWKCGHPVTPENTKPVRNRTGLACRQCHRAIDRISIAKRRAAKKSLPSPPPQ
jgi:hypothetical protein